MDEKVEWVDVNGKSDRYLPWAAVVVCSCSDRLGSALQLHLGAGDDV
jgi:hypothetical protein